MNFPRKPTQIAVIPPFHPYEHPIIYALCDDGSIWSRLDLAGQLWYQVDDLSDSQNFKEP